jgi:hypothetical protein
MAAPTFGPLGAVRRWPDLVDDLFGTELQLWLRFNEGLDPSKDYSSHHRGNLTYAGLPTYNATGGMTNALDEDGSTYWSGATGQYFGLPNYKPFTQGSVFTWLGIMRRTGPSVDNDIAFCTDLQGPHLRVQSNGDVAFFPTTLGTGGKAWIDPFEPGYDAVDTWSLLSLRYDDSTGAVKFGVDATMQAQFTCTDRFPSTTGGFRMMADYSGGNRWKGDVSEVLLTNTWLTDATILELSYGMSDSASRSRTSVSVPRTLPLPWSDGSYWPKENFNPLSGNATFYNPIPASARVHPNSAAIVQRMYNMSDQANGGPGNILTHALVDYQIPVYFPSTSDPLYTITCVGPFSPGYPYQGSQIYCQTAATQASGADHHMAIIQPDGTAWYLWNVTSKDNGAHTIQFGYGGPSTLYNGVRNRPEAIAVGAQAIAGLIHPEELRKGLIPHAIQCVVGCVDTGFTYPANKTATTCTARGAFSSGYPPTSQSWSDANSAWSGMRIRITYTEAEIVALSGIDEWQRTILRCLRDYGMIVTDTGGYNTRVVGSPSWVSLGFTNPWATLGDSLIAGGATKINVNGDGDHVYRWREGIDWTKLQVLDILEGQVFP